MPSGSRSLGLEELFQANGAAAIVVDIRNQLQTLKLDLASLAIIHEAECLQDLVLWVAVQDFAIVVDI